MKKLLPAILLFILSQKLSAQFLALPNSGFENWTGVEPDNWFTNNAHGLCEPVTKSTDAHSGTFVQKRGEVFVAGRAVCRRVEVPEWCGCGGASLIDGQREGHHRCEAKARQRHRNRCRQAGGRADG